MLDHVTIGVTDLERSKAFYAKALKAIIRTTTGHLSSIRTATTLKPFAAILRDRAVRN
jgi:catechol 2,3-dioxygenase-like lactoylglutathione lyase family enzyme